MTIDFHPDDTDGPAWSDDDGVAPRFEGQVLEGEPPTVSAGWRWFAIVTCVLRYVVPIAAIPYGATVLRRGVTEVTDGEALLLLFLRPGKEVILFAGGLLNTSGGPSPLLALLAFLPLGILSSATFFLLGRAYADRFQDGDAPDWLAKAVPADRLDVMLRLLAKRGLTIAFLGRMFALPYTLLAAAAGTTRIRAVPYLAIDALGGVVAFAMTLGIGYALGEAFERAGPWFTGLLFVGVLVLFSLGQKWFEREAAKEGPALDRDRA